MVKFFEKLWVYLGVLLLFSSILVYAAQQTWIVTDHGSYRYSMVGILFCSTLLIIYSILFIFYVAKSESDSWVYRIPISYMLGMKENEYGTKYGQLFLIFGFIVIPSIFSLVFFNKFYHGSAHYSLDKSITINNIQHFEYVPICEAMDLPFLCPESDIQKTKQWHYACPEVGCGTTYIRFWQPLVLLIHSTLASVLGVLLLFSIATGRERNVLLMYIWKKSLKVLVGTNLDIPNDRELFKMESRLFNNRNKAKYPYDLFISYSRSDGSSIANLLFDSLKNEGFEIWFDVDSIKPGMHISDSIRVGLLKSRYTVIIFSESYLEKKWTRAELNFLANLEKKAGHIIIPIWAGVTEDDIAEFNFELSIYAGIVVKNDNLGAVVESVRKILTT